MRVVIKGETLFRQAHLHGGAFSIWEFIGSRGGVAVIDIIYNRGIKVLKYFRMNFPDIHPLLLILKHKVTIIGTMTRPRSSCGGPMAPASTGKKGEYHCMDLGVEHKLSGSVLMHKIHPMAFLPATCICLAGINSVFIQ